MGFIDKVCSSNGFMTEMKNEREATPILYPIWHGLKPEPMHFQGENYRAKAINCSISSPIKAREFLQKVFVVTSMPTLRQTFSMVS